MSRNGLLFGEPGLSRRHALRASLAAMALVGCALAAQAQAAGHARGTLRVSAVVAPRCEIATAARTTSAASPLRVSCANLGSAGVAVRPSAPSEPAIRALESRPGRAPMLAVYY